MATERNVVDFKIHNLTEEQFQELKEQGKIDPNALYCTPDETVVKFEELGERIDAANEQINTKQDIATAINYGNVTNCITEIPQDIKLELNNGALTLKAGSKVYVPNGAGVYDVITITNDLTSTASTNGTHLIGYAPGFSTITTYINAVSGTTEPTTLSNGLTWYDTANNVIKRAWAGSWQASLFSLPVAVVTISNGTITSIDQVFNGLGYIGSTIFTLPGLKGLIPNGRNEDGTLKNIVVQNTSVRTLTRNSGATGTKTICLTASGAPDMPGGMKYNEKENQNYNYDSKSLLGIFGSLDLDSNFRISNFNTKPTFHAVDYSDFENTVEELDNSVVHKTGNETISGEKTFAAQRIIFQNINLGSYKEIEAWSEKNTARLGVLRFTNGSDGVSRTVALNVVNNTDNNNGGLVAGINSTGKLYATAPTPAASSNSTDIATTAFVKSVLSSSGNGLATLSKAQNGYCKFSNGLIIQWGFTGTTAVNTVRTVTMPTAFSSGTSYGVVGMSYQTAGTTGGFSIGISNTTTTTFNWVGPGGGSSSANNLFWIAIGY